MVHGKLLELPKGEKCKIGPKWDDLVNLHIKLSFYLLAAIYITYLCGGVWGTFEFDLSDFRDLRLFRHLIRVMKRHDLTKKIPAYLHTYPPTYLPAHLPTSFREHP